MTNDGTVSPSATGIHTNFNVASVHVTHVTRAQTQLQRQTIVTTKINPTTVDTHRCDTWAEFFKVAFIISFLVQSERHVPAHMSLWKTFTWSSNTTVSVENHGGCVTRLLPRCQLFVSSVYIARVNSFLVSQICLTQGSNKLDYLWLRFCYLKKMALIEICCWITW